MYKCPEIITGANFHFETVKLCILNTNMRFAYYLKKSLLQMILQTYLNYYTHFKAYY